MIAEIYDAFRAANVDDELARKAAEVVAESDDTVRDLQGEKLRLSELVKNPLKNLYFGEQHLHTTNSPDAFAFDTRNGPDDTYKFCKGEAVKKPTTGEMIQKKTPYDWCAVTDHAEYMGIMPLLLKKDNPLKDTEIGKGIATGDPKKGEDAFG